MENELVTRYAMKTGNNWGCGALIVKDDSDGIFILVGKRTDTKDWCTPGGKCEIGESAEEGIKREVKEEVNLSIKKYTFVDTHVGAFNNEKVWITYMFLCTDYTGKEKPQLKELSELKWVSPSELKKLELFPPTKLLLDTCKEKKVIRWW